MKFPIILTLTSLLLPTDSVLRDNIPGLECKRCEIQQFSPYSLYVPSTTQVRQEMFVKDFMEEYGAYVVGDFKDNESEEKLHKLRHHKVESAYEYIDREFPLNVSQPILPACIVTIYNNGTVEMPDGILDQGDIDMFNFLGWFNYHKENDEFEYKLK